MALIVILLGVFLATFLAATTLPNIKKQANQKNQGRIQKLIVLCRAISIISLIAALIVTLNLN